jgi:nucleotide-binding universal stress UspA family protein
MVGLRILVPLDDSFQAQRVLDYVRALAVSTDGIVKLVRITDIEDETSFNSLARNAERLADAGVSVEWDVISGVDAETGIQQAMTAWQPTLLALASTRASGLDRWLNGSVAEKVVKFAHVPVLVVPPGAQHAPARSECARILVPLDGSSSADDAHRVVLALADMMPVETVVMRAARGETDASARAIVERAGELDVDAIAMSTRGQPVASVFERAVVPLILVGPKALSDAQAAQIRLGAAVRTEDKHHVGEVHRVIVDLGQQALVGVVVLGRGELARDVLVPLDFVESVGNDGVRLTLRELDALPDFTFNEFVTPPATWGLPVAEREHKRLSASQQEITHETHLTEPGGELGHVDGVEADLETGRLRAFWVRRDGVFRQDTRIPVEWVHDLSDAKHG